MREIPMLFSTEMVKAILKGTKTETRRIIKGAARAFLEVEFTAEFTASTDNDLCPYGKPGDLLWVRETWAPAFSEICYKADYSSEVLAEDRNKGIWKPSIHMNKAAARIWLQVESVQCERLKSITNESAIAEGIEVFFNGEYRNYTIEHSNWIGEDAAIGSYMSLWEKINGPESALANPWVWVIKFKVLSTTGKPQNLN